MANIILNIGQQKTEEKLEKYVDLDMDSMYKAYAVPKDVDTAAFAKEQAKSIDGLFFEELSKNNAIAVDKHFKKTIAVDYSGYKLSKNVNVKAIQQSVHNIFSWLQGERIINPEFGTNLRKYLYEGITDGTEELINAEIRQCVSKWEPRVEIVSIVNVGTVDDTENNTMHLQITYTIPSLSDLQYTYSYYYNKTA